MHSIREIQTMNAKKPTKKPTKKGIHLPATDLRLGRAKPGPKTSNGYRLQVFVGPELTDKLSRAMIVGESLSSCARRLLAGALK